MFGTLVSARALEMVVAIALNDKVVSLPPGSISLAKFGLEEGIARDL